MAELASGPSIPHTGAAVVNKDRHVIVARGNREVELHSSLLLRSGPGEPVGS